MEPFGLVALDGADDDGGTLYVLYDGAAPVQSASWPHPLEQYAADRGRGVERRPAMTGAPWEQSMTKEAPMSDLIADLDPIARLNGAARVTCKVDGCDEAAQARRGPYALLCDAHRAAKAAGGFKPGKPARAAVAPPAPPVEEPPREHDDGGDDDEVVTFASAARALADTVALIEELQRHVEEERANVAAILEDLGRLVEGV